MTAEQIEAVNNCNEKWQQGDYVLGDQQFIFRYLSKAPATKLSASWDSEEIDYIGEEIVRGLVILTQTCDLIRKVEERPYFEVAPVVEVSEAALSEIKARRQPRYAEVPTLSASRLVADLDRVMTLEKPVLLTWQQNRGCNNDEEKRLFAWALSRKRMRAALPTDFGEMLNPLQQRWKDKHKKDSPEGKIIRAIAEIRVMAKPSWAAEKITTKFFFLIHPKHQPTIEMDQAAIERQVETWLKLPISNAKYTLESWVGGYDELTAGEYVNSDHLDYDHLS
ncbi:MAG: hypothetical protein C5B49_04985 [Bdellovibrio sp.]|nr:MAG: hypothetical protein C5B49_04985 [Bdellovibrio sp.]